MASMIGGDTSPANAFAARLIQIHALLYAKPQVEPSTARQAVVISRTLIEPNPDFRSSGGRFFSNSGSRDFSCNP
jgi:hypothetical protein